MLKPGGQVFIMFAAKNAILRAFVKLSSNEKWASYMERFYRQFYPFYRFKNPADIFNELLRECGFELNVCEVTIVNYNMYKNKDHFARKYMNL